MYYCRKRNSSVSSPSIISDIEHLALSRYHCYTALPTPYKAQSYYRKYVATRSKVYRSFESEFRAKYCYRFSQTVLKDTTPMPESIPSVDEIGATSAPLMSASYFIGARCRSYNDDFMKCKADSFGKGETECLKEGRKVTRCAASV